MESFFHRAASLVGWAYENPLTALFYATIAVSALGTVANSLSYFPRAQAAVLSVARFLGALLKLAGDLLSLVANAKGKGLAGPFTVPGIPTLPKSALEEAQPKDRGHVSLFVLLALLCLGAGCAYVRATAAAIKTCAGETVAAADWNDLKPTIDGLLHMDRPSAFAGLEMIVSKYGEQFITCIVAELKNEYEQIGVAVQASARQQALVDVAAGPERALGNAKAWLERGTVTL